MGSSSAARAARGSHPGGDAEDGQVLDELPSLHRPSFLSATRTDETILPAPHDPTGGVPCLGVPSASRSRPLTAASLAWGEPQSLPRNAHRGGATEARGRARRLPLEARARAALPPCVDKEHGGFHVNYARDWSPLEDRSRFVVYEARVVVDGRHRRPAAARRRERSTCLRPPRRALPRRRDVGPRARGLPHPRGPGRPPDLRRGDRRPAGVRAGLRRLRPRRGARGDRRRRAPRARAAGLAVDRGALPRRPRPRLPQRRWATSRSTVLALTAR